MMTTTMNVAAQGNDAELVTRSLAGDRNAFGEIVARYQSLICSLAYSATGSLSQSEDLAQETFLAAWKQLRALREPAKLKSWLCAIARNLINDNFRKQGREPISHATQIEHVEEPTADQKPPADEAMTKEEEAILWRSLESVPQIYREPLVLFYREGQSVERVAAALEISEDNAKQRLSRGRKLLQEQVTAFVEGALVRSVPGKAFTLGVIAALPGVTLSAKAATLAAGTAKGSSTAKAAFATGVFAAFATPLMAVLGTWVGYRMNMEAAQTDVERVFVKKSYKSLIAFALITGVAFFLIMVFADELRKIHPAIFPTLLLSFSAIWLVTFVSIALTQTKRRTRFVATLRAKGFTVKYPPVREHISEHRLLGLPLYHIRLGRGVEPQVVKAWIAIGDVAFGGIFAFGSIAVAPISLGGWAIGLLPFGGCAMGLVAIGGFALGWYALGAIGAGWLSFSAAAMAWKAAMGGVAVAHDYALGGYAQAFEANTKIAKEFITHHTFFRTAQAMLPYLPWANLLWIAPLLKWQRELKKHNQKR
jgi:RNA polymerase sigma factor (sigma-70 family)